MKTTVIGEIGNNHETNEDIIKSVAFLRSRGCLVKLQAFEKSQFKHLKDYALSKELMKEIKADDVFYSVFSCEMVDWLEENVNPRYYKIASRSYEDGELIKRVAKTGKRIFMSIPYPRYKYDEPFTYLSCISSYPALCAHLEILKDFSGFSDHTTSTVVPALAVAGGARVIEKHFTIREMNSPDRPHSLLPSQWDEMLSNIREAEYHFGL